MPEAGRERDSNSASPGVPSPSLDPDVGAAFAPGPEMVQTTKEEGTKISGRSICHHIIKKNKLVYCLFGVKPSFQFGSKIEACKPPRNDLKSD